jgi:hypothetical protein
MPFSAPMDRYQLFKLDKEDYTRWQDLPAGYRFVRDIDRDAERELLQSEFPHWEIPFNRSMPGLRERGVICVGHGDQIAALSYVCEENELGLDGYAQIHYAVVAPEHRGHRLLSAMVTEMFRRLPHFKGGVFYVDREGHQPMYERWGGGVEGEKPKPPAKPERPGALRRLASAARRLVRRG